MAKSPPNGTRLKTNDSLRAETHCGCVPAERTATMYPDKLSVSFGRRVCIAGTSQAREEVPGISIIDVTDVCLPECAGTVEVLDIVP